MCDLSQDIPDKYVCTAFCLLFSVGKANSWYKSGLASLILCILFYTKYQRDIPG